MALTSRRSGSDESILVVARQIMIVTFLCLAVFAACLTRHGSAVHMWLEGSWWLVATTLAIFLCISGILQLLASTAGSENTFLLQIIEQAELIIYLLLALAASMARRGHGDRYRFLRTGFWMGTVLLVVLWSVSSLLDIMTSERALPGTIITMTATLVVAVLMLADLCVTYWHKMDPTAVTEQDARRQSSMPFLSSHGKSQEEDIREGHDEEAGYDRNPQQADHDRKQRKAAAPKDECLI